MFALSFRPVQLGERPKIRSAIMMCLVLAMVHDAQAQSPFKEISAGDNIHLLVDDECNFNGEYVKRVSLTTNNGVTILYKNRTADAVTPKVTILLLDKYGLPVKEARDNWLLSLAAADSRSNTAHLVKIDVKKLLRFTSLPLPDDAGVVKYIYVEER
ncbi:MAG: hypothetical protein ACI9G1_004138 [Pirellulaceae bacterium]|jgi:hypothetical protein